MNRLVFLLCMSALLWPSVCPSETRSETDFDVRAVWVTRWAFKEPGEVRTLFADLDAVGINMVFFQVRCASDALYFS